MHCASVMLLTRVREIHTTPPLTKFDLVTYFVHWRVSEHKAAKASNVLAQFDLPSCTSLIHHEMNMHRIALVLGK